MRQSRLLIWSESTTPVTGSPAGIVTSKGYPLPRFVIGHINARPTVPLYAAAIARRDVGDHLNLDAQLPPCRGGDADGGAPVLANLLIDT